jgi:hypothetical protein
MCYPFQILVHIEYNPKSIEAIGTGFPKEIYHKEVLNLTNMTHCSCVRLKYPRPLLMSLRYLVDAILGLVKSI